MTNRNVSFNRWREARWPGVERRIKRHPDYAEAGFSWTVWDGLDKLAAWCDQDLKRRTLATLDADGASYAWTCPNCEAAQIHRPNDGFPACHICSFEPLLYAVDEEGAEYYVY